MRRRIWRNIKDFEGYQVSTYGEVRSYWNKDGSLDDKPHFLQPRKINKFGHVHVALYRDGIAYNKPIHRLVAEAFIANPNHYPLVRHLNGDASDNRVENLAWGTYKDNTRDSIEMGTFHYNYHYFTKEENKKSVETNRTPVKAINIITGEEHHFRSQQEAGRCLGLSQGNINLVLNHIRNRTGDYVFEYVSKEEEKICPV